MKTRFFIHIVKRCILFVLPVMLAGCMQTVNNTTASVTMLTTVSDSRGEQRVSPHPQRIVSYDFGSVDTLLMLNADVIALPLQSVPAYIQRMPHGIWVDAGGMENPDLSTVRTLKPDLIIITGRQSQQYAQLKSIAPVLDLSDHPQRYLDSVKYNVNLLAKLTGALQAAELALIRLQMQVDQARSVITGSGYHTLVLIHNDGHFFSIPHPVLFQVLGAIPSEAVLQQVAQEPSQRIPLSITEIQDDDPDVIFIIDRSAAIGKTPLDVELWLKKGINQTKAAKQQRIVLLQPDLWYLSGGGLHSLPLQVEEVLTAYQQFQANSMNKKMDSAIPPVAP